MNLLKEINIFLANGCRENNDKIQNPLLIRICTTRGTEVSSQYDKGYLKKPTANTVLSGEALKAFPSNLRR